MRSLFGPSCPRTLLVGLCACAVHVCGVLVCVGGLGAEGYSWCLPPLLGYTVGAVCRMYQFVVAGEVRRHLVLYPEWLDALSRKIPLATPCAVHAVLLRLLLLPCLCTDHYEYYAYHHANHYEHLGGSSLSE